MTTVRVDTALTKNLGDFNSLKIAVAVEDELPPVPEGAMKSEAIDKHIDRLYNIVSAAVDRKVAEAERQLKG